MFHRDLVYSTINGYYFIRLLDNVMDQHADDDKKLLPAVAFFQTEFTRVYEKYFAIGHPFWNLFRKAWIRTNEAAVRGAFTMEFGTEEFKSITVLKLEAAKIPLIATAYRARRPDLIRPWLDFCERLARWCQMMDDLFDWRGDLRLGQDSYFLSEARRRKRREECVEAWVVREGFDWGMELLKRDLGRLHSVCMVLGSDELKHFLVTRDERLARDHEELGSGLNALQKTAEILGLLPRLANQY